MAWKAVFHLRLSYQVLGRPLSMALTLAQETTMLVHLVLLWTVFGMALPSNLRWSRSIHETGVFQSRIHDR